MILVEGIETFSYGFENIPPKSPVSLGLSLQDVQLDVEELFEFQTKFGLFILACGIRENGSGAWQYPGSPGSAFAKARQEGSLQISVEGP